MEVGFMITTVSIRSPYVALSGPSPAPAPPVPTHSAGPADNVSLSAEAPPETHGVSWKAVGLTALLAAPMLAGALTMASADEMPAPQTVSTCLVASDSVTAQAIPIEKSYDHIKELSSTTPLDNATVQGVRTGYSRAADAARTHAAAFADDFAHLEQQGKVLEARASDVGTTSEGACTVQIAKDAAATTVSMTGAEGSASLQMRDGMRMVTVRHGDEVRSLLESDAQRQITDGNITRTLYLEDIAGHKAGDFEVVVRDGQPQGMLPGSMRRMEHLVVSGTTVTDEVRESISGFAGNIDVHRLDRFEVPQLTAHVFPQVRLRETYRAQERDGLTGQQTSTTRVVEVRQDGSARIRQTTDGATTENVEPPAVIVR
jgi:hypothetical protein